MEIEIQNKLKTTIFNISRDYSGGGGCINSGNVYDTDNGKVFVKQNSEEGANIMFEGEYFGLLHFYGGPIRVPKPLLYGKRYLVMEYINMSMLSKYSGTLGEALARLHRANSSGDDSKVGHQSRKVDRFGFDKNTCCGFIPMINDWNEDWLVFYSSQRLEPQIKMIQKKHGDRQIGELWSQLQIKIPGLFQDIEVTPSLLHGDLWSGNVAETESEPVIYDPAAFYGHDEFDLAIARMFGGIPETFFSAYHRVIPKKPGFKQRQDLYTLFHKLNHWNHFGVGYKRESLSLMTKLIN